MHMKKCFFKFKLSAGNYVWLKTFNRIQSLHGPPHRQITYIYFLLVSLNTCKHSKAGDRILRSYFHIAKLWPIVWVSSITCIGKSKAYQVVDLREADVLHAINVRYWNTQIYTENFRRKLETELGDLLQLKISWIITKSVHLKSRKFRPVLPWCTSPKY